MPSRRIGMSVREAYAVLGLDASCTSYEQARTRFRELIRANHPDGKPAHEQGPANEATRTIVEACAVLRAAGRLHATPRSAPAARNRMPGDYRPAAYTPDLADLQSMFDDIWREYVRGTLLFLVVPPIYFWFTLSSWMVRAPSAGRLK